MKSLVLLLLNKFFQYYLTFIILQMHTNNSSSSLLNQEMQLNLANSSTSYSTNCHACKLKTKKFQISLPILFYNNEQFLH